jgi:hypothetical protein
MTGPTGVLPELRQHASPNHSSRLGTVPYLIVVHRPVGSFDGAEATLCSTAPPPEERVSAHALFGTGRRAVQLVPWDLKAWACAAFNRQSYNLEVGDEAWTKLWHEDDNSPGAVLFREAARAVAFLSVRTGIPPRQSLTPTHDPGVVRHYDLGRAGGGHTDPTTNAIIWSAFLRRVKAEHDRGGFRPTYGVGKLARIEL